jgi:hypothetical protein
MGGGEEEGEEEEGEDPFRHSRCLKWERKWCPFFLWQKYCFLTKRSHHDKLHSASNDSNFVLAISDDHVWPNPKVTGRTDW